MQKKPLILIGGGGHCRSCIDIIEQENKYQIKGILDTGITSGTFIDGYSILGNDSLLDELAKKNNHFLITIGQIKNASIRIEIYTKLLQLNASLATIISPTAYVSSKTKIGSGTIIMHHAILNAGVSVGSNCIINTKALLEHDSSIGNHSHISTASVINGGCKIGDETFIGSNTIISNGIQISNKVSVGAASYVNKNIKTPGLYLGVPAYKYEK